MKRHYPTSTTFQLPFFKIIMYTWNRYADFTDGTEIAAGNYTLKATYGNIETQGFEAPYYEGAKEFSIKKNESTNISVICYLANVKVTTEYTELFKKYFTDYTVNIRPAGSTDISFDKNETRAAYVKPGKISIYLSGSKQQGNKVTFEAATMDRTRIPFISLADGAWRNIQMCLDNPLSFSVKQGMACRD